MRKEKLFFNNITLYFGQYETCGVAEGYLPWHRVVIIQVGVPRRGWPALIVYISVSVCSPSTPNQKNTHITHKPLVCPPQSTGPPWPKFAYKWVCLLVCMMGDAAFMGWSVCV